MDFWDLTKLLFRRWYFAAPLLVATVVAAVMTLALVRPNYIATAHLQPVTPMISPGTDGSTAVQRNPWIALGVSTLANAASVTVQDASVLEELVDKGYSDSFTITMNNDTGLVMLEVSGTTPEQATQTTALLADRYTASMQQLQVARGVAKEDLITTVRLDAGINLKESDSNVKRALVAVIVAGLLLTVAWTIGLDAIVRRRKRRQLPGSGDGMLDLPNSAGARSDQPISSPPKTNSTIKISQAATPSSDRSRSGGSGGRGAPAVDYRVPARGDTAGAERGGPDGSGAANNPPMDATIVLPLSNPSWRQRDSADGR